MYFLHSELAISQFLTNLSLPWKQSLPWIFQAKGEDTLPPPPRLVRHWLLVTLE